VRHLLNKGSRLTGATKPLGVAGILPVIVSAEVSAGDYGHSRQRIGVEDIARARFRQLPCVRWTHVSPVLAHDPGFTACSSL
jgi:hypothetical protein